MVGSTSMLWTLASSTWPSVCPGALTMSGVHMISGMASGTGRRRFSSALKAMPWSAVTTIAASS